MWGTEILILFISTLIAIAFLTLAERKILGYIQIRKSPNKVSMMGILQPIADAIKLFTKSFLQPMKSTKIKYLQAPLLALSLCLTMWSLNPLSFSTPNMKFSTLFFMTILSLNIYTFMMAGWSSNSWYATIGCYRAVAQTISYEITLAFLILSLLLMFNSFNFQLMKIYKMYLLPPFILLFFIWMNSLLAETNRSPFDFAEGESELVSGFNTEYSGSAFALLFLAEYGFIIFSCLTTSLFFFSSLILIKWTLILMFVILWIRGSSPRLRYDKLMNLAWMIFLPVCISLFMIKMLMFTMMI